MKTFVQKGPDKERVSIETIIANIIGMSMPYCLPFALLFREKGGWIWEI